MKCILISVLWVMILPYLSQANWCIKETTFNTRVTKALTKTVTSRKWFGGVKRRTVSYFVTELVPRVRQHRVCCEGYTLDSVHRICEPMCPAGCHQFAGCVKPNICECHKGYQKTIIPYTYRCDPICEPDCSENAFCSSPNLCLCKSGFEYTDSTKSCLNSTSLDSIPTSTLADLTTVRVVSSEPTAKPQRISTILAPPTTETTRMALRGLSTASGTTSESSSTKTTTTTAIRPSSEGTLSEERTTREYTTSTEQTLSSEGSGETSTFASTVVSASCENDCFNGLCINGLCKCPNGSVFSSKANGCVLNSSCDLLCHNGICQENGVCECLQGFVYQYNQGCVPNCDQKCINGICIAPAAAAEAGKCKCLDGFALNPKNSFECVPAGKLAEQLKRYDDFYFPWIWVLLITLVIVFIFFGLFIIKKSRKHNYNVDKIEETRHIVYFEGKDM